MSTELLNTRLELSDTQLKQIAEHVRPFLEASDPCCSRQDELMTVSELARFLKVKTSWVYNGVYTKRLPHLKAGKHLRFDKERILEYLQENGSAMPEPAEG